jgi:hypothetical protein
MTPFACMVNAKVVLPLVRVSHLMTFEVSEIATFPSACTDRDQKVHGGKLTFDELRKKQDDST